MIIDARTATSAEFGRPYTTSTAVAMALNEIPVGGHADVSALVDQVGATLPRIRLDVLVAKHRRDRRFSVRQQPGMLARIYRLA